MDIYERLVSKQAKLAVIGLGYVGLPIAVAFAKSGLDVIGFDINKKKVELYNEGIDITNEIGNKELEDLDIVFTYDECFLKQASFFIIAVPTPVSLDKTPDLEPVINASKIVGRNMCLGSYVIYESTVYPGVTEDICVRILEEISGLKCVEDFKIGYSPERINPGDKVHKLENIVKIVSGIDEESLNYIAKVYEIVVKVGVYKASSIKVAEAAKVVENSQRDINIAFMNELAMVFERMKIDTNEVIEAMNTKWNALNFSPGLVGGHCIGVDPYYFIYEAEKLGYHSQIIAAGRKINDNMGVFIADEVIKKLVLANKRVKSCKIAILGITFKENCPDVRNSKVYDIIKRLDEYGIDPIVYDPWADCSEVKREYNIELQNLDTLVDVDCLIFAVAHEWFKELSWAQIKKMFNENIDYKLIVDIKSIFSKDEIESNGFDFWRL